MKFAFICMQSKSLEKEFMLKFKTSCRTGFAFLIFFMVYERGSIFLLVLVTDTTQKVNLETVFSLILDVTLTD